MMEQSPEMIGGAGRQTHLMRSFVSRHNHLALLGIVCIENKENTEIPRSARWL
jgi:hypothetical protein